jgi:1-deoxy-D-xylulose-5-phosphate synthase
MRHEKTYVVAIIGDGSLGGGMAFEALNNAGSRKSEILVILNDNRMSISPNVGALSRYLTTIIANPAYSRRKDDIWELTGRVFFGAQLRPIAGQLEDGVKNLLVPGMFFEQLGFEYYGPIDGHDIKEIVTVLREIKDVRKPKLLHVITEKGKGYEPAVSDKPRFHGMGLSTGKPAMTGERLRAEKLILRYLVKQCWNSE